MINPFSPILFCSLSSTGSVKRYFVIMAHGIFCFCCCCCFFCYRMELFGEKRAKLLSKLIPGSVQLNLGGFLFYSPGVEAYGEWVVHYPGKGWRSKRQLHSLFTVEIWVSSTCLIQNFIVSLPQLCCNTVSLATNLSFIIQVCLLTWPLAENEAGVD